MQQAATDRQGEADDFADTASEETDFPRTGRQAGKLTQKQEAFARAYIETGNASEAYRRAYDTNASAKTTHEKASRLLKEGKVRARLVELQAASAEKHGITVDSLTNQLLEDRKLARELGQPSAAVSATMGIAKLHGLIIDKAKVDVSTPEDALRALQQLVKPQERTDGPSVH